jgi:hypothetical protein
MAGVDVVRSAVAKGGTLVADRWRAFREESPYFQAKVGLVAAWLVVSLVTIVVVPPPTIPFVVEQQASSFGLSTKTTLIVFNADGGDLINATVEISGTVTEFDGRTIPGSYRTKPITIVEGLKTTLSTESFFGAKGDHPGYQIHIDRVVIRDDDDEVVYDGPAGEAAKRTR